MDEFEYMQKLAGDDEEVERLLRNAGLQGLTRQVRDGLKRLAQQEAATGTELNDKLIVKESSFEMCFGDIELFYGGLTGLLGPPRMVATI